MSLDLPYILFPIDIYSSHICNCHRFALIATQNLFSGLLSLGANYEKSQVHRITENDLER